MNFKITHLLLFVVAAFLLYHLTNSCANGVIDGFSVGGSNINISEDLILDDCCDYIDENNACYKLLNEDDNLNNILYKHILFEIKYLEDGSKQYVEFTQFGNVNNIIEYIIKLMNATPAGAAGTFNDTQSLFIVKLLEIVTYLFIEQNEGIMAKDPLPKILGSTTDGHIGDNLLILGITGINNNNPIEIPSTFAGGGILFLSGRTVITFESDDLIFETINYRDATFKDNEPNGYNGYIFDRESSKFSDDSDVNIKFYKKI